MIALSQSPVKYLIVNADDFGASRSINRGILQTHRHGILTSTSLLVYGAASREAAELGRDAPELSVGLHVDLGKELNESTAESSGRLREALGEQFSRFQELMGRPPTHLDSHHNVHRDPRALLQFLDAAQDYGLPLREHSMVRYFPKFYGQWGGETHLEQISVENLTRMLETEIQDGVTELSCHPGYEDPDYPTGYSAEREIEIRTLCDPRARQALAQRMIRLISYHDLAQQPLTTGISAHS
jgi:predicted glycoside hydrolase/deacetylase ChbG (UPF0249 family)